MLLCYGVRVTIARGRVCAGTRHLDELSGWAITLIQGPPVPESQAYNKIQ